jgi:large subunit ribosomal protein L29
MTKAAELREMESDELHGRVAELKEEQFNLRFQLATGQLDNHARIGHVRREIARIRTILRERDFDYVEAARRAPAAAPAEAKPKAQPETPEPEAAAPEPPAPAEEAKVVAKDDSKDQAKDQDGQS